MKIILVSLSILLSANLYSQQPPGTEIYVLDLSIQKSKVKVSNPQNITNRAGYDNQPFFHPDKPLIYYASAEADGKTDIKEFNYSTKSTRNITTTSEREYSPTVTPDKLFLSCIIQRDNGAQDLGKYPIDGGAPEVIINTLTVGYHAWINSDELLLFVLGDTMTLHRVNLTSRKDEIIAQNIGRSLHAIPKSNAMSFVQKILEKEWLIKKVETNGTITTIKSTLPGREDSTWTPDGKILMSDGKSLFYYWLGKTEMWTQISLPGVEGKSITRLAVSSKGDKLAIVVSE
jgi:Tol biopolymer transport system component